MQIPKGYPEAVNRRRTDYIMAKRKKKRTSDLQNITHKTKDRVTRTLLKTGGKLICPGRIAVPVPLVALVVLI